MKEMFRTKVGKCFAILLLMVFLFLPGCNGGGGDGNSGGTIRLAWDANTEADLAGYKVYYGTSSYLYDHSLDVGLATQSDGTVYYTLAGLTSGQTYFIAVTAYDTSGNESAFSDEESGAAK